MQMNEFPHSFQSESSNIDKVVHDGVSTLGVKFKNGRTYAYTDVPIEVFQVMRAVDEQTGSCGSHFNKTVRNAYTFIEVDGEAL